MQRGGGTVVTNDSGYEASEEAKEGFLFLVQL